MIDLGGREFKLLLEPSVLGGDNHGLDGAKHFGAMLEQSVCKLAQAPEIGAMVCKGEFEEDKRRVVRFWEDQKNGLDSLGFIIRTRRKANSDWKPEGKSELTLKFRTDDVVLASLAHAIMRDTEVAGTEIKFEEDIAPLQIEVPSNRGLGPVVRPERPKMRGRFSVSCEAERDENDSLRIDDVNRKIGGFERCYRMARGAFPEGEKKLQPGPEVREATFDGMKIPLDEDVDAKSCLTIWDIPDRRAIPIVEFSYKVSLTGKGWSEDAARRATQLFLGLQSSLPLNAEFTSKTEFALPLKSAPDQR